VKRFVVTVAFVVGVFVLTGCDTTRVPSNQGPVPPAVELDLDFDGTKTKTKTVTPSPQVIPQPQQRRTNPATQTKKPVATKR
jgi:hypothetical protein